MKIFLTSLIFFTLAIPALAQSPEEQGVFNLNQNPLEPGQAPVMDQRLAPSKETGGIMLPQENSDLPKEAAIVFNKKSKKSFVSKDFTIGFVAGGVLIAFVSFFMLKFAQGGNNERSQND